MTVFEPTPHTTFADMRLTRLALQDPHRCATVNEYAGATGIAVSRILELLAPALEAGMVDLEPIGGEIFVHTGAGLPANLWETLRRGRTPDVAFALWRLVRGLEAGGWGVESDPANIPVVVGHTTLLALRMNSGHRIPLLVLPEPAELSGPASPLTRYAVAGRPTVAVACRNGELDRVVTSVRQWLLRHEAGSDVNVVVLEAPRYQPVLLSGGDSSVAPRAVSQVSFSEMFD